MAESFGEAGTNIVSGALDVSIICSREPGGGAISFHCSTDNIVVARELCKLSGYVSLGFGATSLCALYGYRFLKPLIKDAFNAAFGGRRGDQKVKDVRPGESLHVLLRCYTDERFLEVLEDYENGGISERLQKEFSRIGIQVDGLEIEIENMAEVEKRKAIIKKRYRKMFNFEQFTKNR